ncbi:DUF7282 domain-containing protein [Pseudoroseicyclus sp. H15]
MINKFTQAAALSISASVLASVAAAQDTPMIMVDGVTATTTEITVPEVMLDQPGFVVVHEMVDGAPVVPASIGHAYVEAGTTDGVMVDLDKPLMGDSQYMLMLHYDTDGDGEYSFGEGMTDVDTPVMMDGAPVTKVFATAPGMTVGDAATEAVVDIAQGAAAAAGAVAEGAENLAESVADGAESLADDLMDTPMIMVSGATAGGMTVTVPEVMIDQPGFLVVHDMVDGSPVVPASIGHTYLEAGMNTDVAVQIDETFSSDNQYMLMLHYDTDGDGVYSFGEGMTDVDTPVMEGDAPVTAVFQPSM